MSAYTSEYPSIPFDPAYKKFFEDFYAASDVPDAHEKYVEFYTQDATLIMASNQVQGTSDILAFRKSMWEKVSSRIHNPLKIFPFGPNSDEVMLRGTVQYGLKAGGEASVDWGAYARLTKVNGEVKLAFYQVYLVSLIATGF
ncbi:hypothetical protein BU24DRAFT_358898 [Aaosphaeria arxii CBS 175.79]|uniref:SnoaL-like domain-containing protein n=1 Tax=Aaosphaeria arxii CBS 175.79 TaxID=1450172 RepID=A0A6A5X8E9_9PLEO|nr:uncharacterized protein BU24DRAFT_358898 [Aaosphaeria arxii CBS 175.79]KAF2009180.1 hypothetical protein BU24DRAFT_358898 [Aaosphaeria arxii CBS 175.79]